MGSKKNFSMGSKGKITPEALEEISQRMVRNGMMSNDNAIVMPEKVLLDDTGKKVELFNLDEGIKERERVDELNESLYETRNPIVDQINLIGNRVLIRLYRLQKYTKEGFMVGGRTQEVKSESELRKKIVDMDDSMQFQDRGVVIAISSDCTEAFREKVKPGSIVDVDPHLFASGRSQRWLEKDNTAVRFDNYFIMPEHAIEYVINF